MKTSVIITVYNRPEMLGACLWALALQSDPPDEAVVSDDGSGPEAAERMRALFGDLPFPVRYVWQEDRGYRLAAARNNAIRAAGGDYLVSLDCDVLLMPEALAIHRQRARRGVFLAANRAWVGEQDTRTVLRQTLTPRLLDVLWTRSDRRHLRPAHRQFVRNRLLRSVGLARRNKPKILGCHFSLFREDIEKINGFDEQYVGWGLEDDDFALRLHRAGIRGQSLVLEARALHLWHAPAGAGAGSPRQSANWDYFNRREIPARCAAGLTRA